MPSLFVGLAVTLLAAGQAEAATVPDGYVALGSGMGVESARVLADGTLELTLAGGSVRVYGAGDFVVLEGGGIAVSEAVASDLTALAEVASDIGLAEGAAAGLLGAAAVAGAGGSDADSATIGGDVSGEVVEDVASTLTTSGTLTVTDVDTGEAEFAAQTDTAGSNGYGVFLGTDGFWSYAADNTQAATQGLGAGETLTDSFTAVTADGTTQVVTVTIVGGNEPVDLFDIKLGTGGH